MPSSLLRAWHFHFGSSAHARAPARVPAHAEKQPHDPRQSTSTGTGTAGTGSSTSTSTSAAVAQALADLGLRRRRSTGASGAEPVAAVEGGAAMSMTMTMAAKRKSHKLARMSTSGAGANVGVSSADRDRAPPAEYPGPHPASASASAPAVPPPPATPIPTPTPTPTPTMKGKVRTEDGVPPHSARFSTADRAILAELAAGVRARAAQFTVKGVGHTVRGGGRSAGKRHHAYPAAAAPYPRAYDREVVDLDVWETLFMMDIGKNLSWHVFETPPSKVLEIGCGTGTWILHCARVWKETHFVGLDLVPLHPDLNNVGSPDLAARITWVQHNFLEGLPFQNGEFDFVHIKRIALGVPEDKWDALFEEVARVMKPGGRLEMIEEDLFFPGKKVDHDDDDRSAYRDDASSIMTRQDSISSAADSGRRRSSVTINGEARLDDVKENADSAARDRGYENANAKESANGNGNAIAQEAPATPKSRAGALLPASPGHRAGSGSVSSHEDAHGTGLRPAAVGGGRHHIPSASVLGSPGAPASAAATAGFVPPHSRASGRPALHVRTLEKEKDPYADLVYGPSVSVLGSMGYLAYQDPLAETLRRHRKLEAAQRAREKREKEERERERRRPGASPFLSTLMHKGPVNPRDHTLLRAVWEGMLEGRFVNASPLSLLTPYLEYHFKDVRTHPPILYTFPPTPPKPPKWDDEDEDEPLFRRPARSGPSTSESETDDAREGAEGAGTGDQRWLSLQALLDHKSPYVSFDGARGHAYSPATQAARRAGAGAGAGAKTTQLNVPMVAPRVAPGAPRPGGAMQIDLNTLHLHLALRAKEIVACSESMWEWVAGFQAGPAGDEARAAARRGRGASTAAPAFAAGVDAADGGNGAPDEDATRGVILDMTREDFDRMLCNFEWDMLDKAALGHALREQFHWHTFEGALLLDRKAYDQACEKYDEWVEQQRAQKLAAAAEQYSQGGSQHQPRGSLSTPGLVLPPPEYSASDPAPIARSQSSPQPAPAFTFTPLTPALPVSAGAASSFSLASSARRVPDSAGASHHSGGGEAASVVSSTQVPPTEMLSRTIRVFLAWKGTPCAQNT